MSKKINKLANKRNYMKRIIRELFRQNYVLWNNYDIVVRVQKSFVHDDFMLVNTEFLRLTKVFIKSYAD